jgi:2-aminoadipate transaminase
MGNSLVASERWTVCLADLPARTGYRADGPLLQRAIQEGVLYVPGEFCYPPGMAGVPRNEMRLSFGLARLEELREGVRRLARALAACWRDY